MTEIKRIEKMILEENYDIDYFRINFNNHHKEEKENDSYYRKFVDHNRYSPIKISLDISKNNNKSQIGFDLLYFNVDEFGKDLQTLGRLVNKKYKNVVISNTSLLPKADYISREDDCEEPNTEEEDYNA